MPAHQPIGDRLVYGQKWQSLISLDCDIMLAAPVLPLTWTLKHSWRGQGKDAGNHQEGGSTWAVLACEGEEGGG